ncbi:hypothetical protein [Chitinophaga varians]|uniref:hypothetical protein n=1 Tax=Chitinophaga varians TaxID=2202339 RepID=UPI00165FEE1B|nr:hypothetical protein [Chitinophaga varians]MBC9913485.1 hypothetical protein [Chitinophaga varians]
MKKVLITICYLFASFSLFSQEKQEIQSAIEPVKHILHTETSCKQLQYRLDTLNKLISGRVFLNRDVDFSHRHIRLQPGFFRMGYCIDVLTKNDTIVLSCITGPDSAICFRNYDTSRLNDYLHQRNKFYQSSKSADELFAELSTQEFYAFYCGEGMQKTEGGKYTKRLVEEKNTAALTDMLRSFNCETQAFGVAGFYMLKEKNYAIPAPVKRLISHIKKRNSTLAICSGCFLSVEKIYK